MKHKRSILIGTLMAILLVLSFGVGQAYATTGCFNDTNGHWAETFICWMKNNSITGGIGNGNYDPEGLVTRAQMAVFLKAQAEVPPSTGRILVSAGMGNWKPFVSTDPLVFGYFSNDTGVFNSSGGLGLLSVHPDLPTVFYGKNLQFVGVEFCYGASVDTVLNLVQINTYTHTSGPGAVTTLVNDTTARTDTACRLYSFPAPVEISTDDGINMFIQVNWVDPFGEFTIGRTTFIFEPTTTTAPAPSALETQGTNVEAPSSPKTTDPRVP